MDVKEILLSKNGKVVMELARMMLYFEVGERILTVTEMCNELNQARGTIQNAIKTLEMSNAVQTESKGHMGSYLTYKNERLLLEFAGVSTLVGTMPLPYSKRYEGLASGLVSALENNYNIPVTMSYMRGARNRIAMVLEGRYDFAVISKYAALEFLKTSSKISIIKEFGVGTYCSAHAIIFHDYSKKEIEDGMRVGIDIDSVDQTNMTKMVCNGKDVQFYPTAYSSVVEKVVDGDLDAAVWNIDELSKRVDKLKFVEVTENSMDDTNAVIITSKDRSEIGYILTKMIDCEQVLRVQKLVMDGKITPSY